MFSPFCGADGSKSSEIGIGHAGLELVQSKVGKFEGKQVGLRTCNMPRVIRVPSL